MRVQQKPIWVSAVQFSGDNFEDIKSHDLYWDRAYDCPVFVNAMGEQTLRPGDWLVMVRQNSRILIEDWLFTEMYDTDPLK